MSLLTVLVLYSTDMHAIGAALEAKGQQASHFLERSPIILDCQLLGEAGLALDFVELKLQVSKLGFVPVGLRNLWVDAEAKALEAGWALLRPSKQQPVANTPAVTEVNLTPVSPEAVQRLLVLDRPVRSGQQVYCPQGDIVVLQHTSAGSELLAGGSVHVYGALRGRVLAGVQGDTQARIFCERLEAELIAIAGRYRLLDEIESNLKGQSVMIYLDQEKLKIVPI
ncbi:MAG: septum site-determining protein MinC [Thiothrix sp.]|nr:MAG: septum site-determining protein MinC [Thiothrix sp.]